MCELFTLTVAFGEKKQAGLQVPQERLQRKFKFSDILGSFKTRVPIISGLFEKIFVGLKKNFGPKKIFVQKKFWSKKNFGPKKILVQKKLWSKKNYGPKKFWSKKIFSPKKI